MEIIKCGKGDITIKLDGELSCITISAFGERILDYSGFCISVNSIKQVEPIEKKLSIEEKKVIVQAISNWASPTMPIEFSGTI